MGNTICTYGFPPPAISASCFTARCDSIWYGFFIATLLFSAKENSLSAYQGWERGSRYFLRSTGHFQGVALTPAWHSSPDDRRLQALVCDGRKTERGSSGSGTVRHRPVARTDSADSAASDQPRPE